jgi:hypothetical protein
MAILFIIITFFPQLWFALFHRAHKHVANSRAGESIKSTTNSIDGNHEEVFGASIIRTVYHLN